MSATSERVLSGLGEASSALEDRYRDLHAHPELSLQERRTAGLAADGLRSAGYEVTQGVGGTGVVGLLRNGDGPTVMLRADMDALPIREATGLPYASTAGHRHGRRRPGDAGHARLRAHARGLLAGAASLLARSPEAWCGTVLAVFQPAEETAEGAQAMIDDGLFDRFPSLGSSSASTSWPRRPGTSRTGPASPKRPRTPGVPDPGRLRVLPDAHGQRPLRHRRAHPTERAPPPASSRVSRRVRRS